MENVVDKYTNPNSSAEVFYIIFIVIAIILVIREIVCWYFKINALKKSIENIDKNLSYLVQERKNSNMRNNLENNKSINNSKTDFTEKDNIYETNNSLGNYDYKEDINDEVKVENKVATDKNDKKNTYEPKSTLKEVLTKERHISDLFGNDES